MAYSHEIYIGDLFSRQYLWEIDLNIFEECWWLFRYVDILQISMNISKEIFLPMNVDLDNFDWPIMWICMSYFEFIIHVCNYSIIIRISKRFSIAHVFLAGFDSLKGLTCDIVNILVCLIWGDLSDLAYI